jgi:hypothetical protein
VRVWTALGEGQGESEHRTTADGAGSIDPKRPLGEAVHVGLGRRVSVALGERGEEPVAVRETQGGAVRGTRGGAIASLAPSVAQSAVVSPAPLLLSVNESKWHRVNVTDPGLDPAPK